MTYTVLIIYLIVLIIIAVSSYKKVINYHDFFVARKLGSYRAVTGSLVATILGGSAIIGAIDAGSTMGWASAWFMLCASAGLFLLIPFIKKISQIGRFTLPGLLGDIYGPKPKQIASYIIPVAWLGIVAAQIIAAARILHSFTGMHYETGVILSAIVFTAYTVAGGQISILRTDALQSILIVTGMLVIALFAAKTEIRIPEQTGHLRFPFNPNFSPFDLIILLFTYATTFTVGPDIYSRIFCANHYITARKSVITTAIILIPVAIVTGYLSIYGTGLPDGYNYGASIINITMAVMPAFIAPLVVLALLSAVLSSADTTMLSSAIIITDIIEKNGFGKKSLKITRLIILIIGACGLVIALHFTSIIGMLLMALAVFSGAFTLPVLAGLSGIKIDEKLLSAAIIAGGTIALCGKITAEFYNPVLGNSIILAAFFTNGILLTAGRKKKALTTT